MKFDGGQWVTKAEAAGGHMEGAKSVRRLYDPKTNEISGEAQQGGEGRWLQGWINIDKLVQEK